ncbi:unnamed protein product, partial [Rotaria magnacalcarata]
TAINDRGSIQRTSGQLEDLFKRLQIAVRERLTNIINLLSKTELDDNQSCVADVYDLLAYLKEMVGFTPISRIGFSGRRGAGKTTLINHILGDDLLPTGGGRAITATLIEIIGWSDKRFVSVITFVKELEWEKSVMDAKNDWDEISANGKNDSDADEETSPAIYNLEQKLRALWEDRFESEFPDFGKQYYRFQNRTALELLPETFQDLLSKKYDIISCEDLPSMKQKLAQYAKRREQYWPLISYLSIYGPFDKLRDGSFSLLDIPGEGDKYEFSLNDRYEQGRSLCDRLFFIPEESMLISPATAKVCVSLGNRLTTQFAVVVTHMDEHLKNFSEENWTDENIEQKIRSELCKTLQAETEKQLMQNTEIYCVENGPNVSRYNKHFQGFLDAAIFRKSHDDIEDCIDRYLQPVDVTFQFLTASISMTVNQTQSIRNEFAKLSNLFLPKSLQKQIIQNWFENLEKIPGEDLFDYVPHYTYLQRILKAEQLVLAEKLLSRVVNSNSLEKLQNIVKNSVSNLQQDIVESYKKCTEKYPDVLAVITAISVQIPYMDRFQLKCLHDAKKAVVKKYGKQWLDMYSIGTGCRNRMLTSLNEWEKTNREAIRKSLGEAISASCESWVEHNMESFEKDFQKRWDHFLKYPEIAKLKDNTKLLTLLSPITRAGVTSSNQSQFLKITFPEEANQLLLNLTSLQKLNQFIEQHKEILSPVQITEVWTQHSKAGCVHVMGNLVSIDGICKIEMPIRHIEQRMKEIDSVAIPSPLEEMRSWSSEVANIFEKLMHDIFHNVRVNRRWDFFQAPLELILQVGDLVDCFLKDITKRFPFLLTL